MLKRLLSESCPERGRGTRELLLPRAPAYPEDGSPGAAGEAPPRRAWRPPGGRPAHSASEPGRTCRRRARQHCPRVPRQPSAPASGAGRGLPTRPGAPQGVTTGPSPLPKQSCERASPSERGRGRAGAGATAVWVWTWAAHEPCDKRPGGTLRGRLARARRGRLGACGPAVTGSWGTWCPHRGCSQRCCHHPRGTRRGRPLGPVCRVHQNCHHPRASSLVGGRASQPRWPRGARGLSVVGGRSSMASGHSELLGDLEVRAGTSVGFPWEGGGRRARRREGPLQPCVLCSHRDRGRGTRVSPDTHCRGPRLSAVCHM